jgi:hypothetical protein
MIFRHLGVSVGNQIASATHDEQLKSITLRFPENEISFYDVLAKAMGLTRQDFMQHLIRSTFNDAAFEFASGYLESKPKTSLQDFLYSHTDCNETKKLIDVLLNQLDHIFRKKNDEFMREIDSGDHDYISSSPNGLYEVQK